MSDESLKATIKPVSATRAGWRESCEELCRDGIAAIVTGITAVEDIAFAQLMTTRYHVELVYRPGGILLMPGRKTQNDQAILPKAGSN